MDALLMNIFLSYTIIFNSSSSAYGADVMSKDVICEKRGGAKSASRPFFLFS